MPNTLSDIRPDIWPDIRLNTALDVHSSTAVFVYWIAMTLQLARASVLHLVAVYALATNLLLMYACSICVYPCRSLLSHIPAIQLFATAVDPRALAARRDGDSLCV